MLCPNKLSHGILVQRKQVLLKSNVKLVFGDEDSEKPTYDIGGSGLRRIACSFDSKRASLIVGNG